MLKLNPDPTFTDDVPITVPGQKELGTVPLTFKYRTAKQYTEWYDGMKEVKENGKAVKEGRKIKEAFPEFVLGWGLKEEFNQENIEIFLDNYPTAYEDIFKFYMKALFVSRVKN